MSFYPSLRFSVSVYHMSYTVFSHVEAVFRSLFCSKRSAASFFCKAPRIKPNWPHKGQLKKTFAFTTYIIEQYYNSNTQHGKKYLRPTKLRHVWGQRSHPPFSLWSMVVCVLTFDEIIETKSLPRFRLQPFLVRRRARLRLHHTALVSYAYDYA